MREMLIANGIRVVNEKIAKADVEKAKDIIAKTIMQDEEGRSFETFTKAEGKTLASKILSEIARASKSLVSKHEDEQTEDSSVPSAPDTSKFRALKSGKIEYMADETIHGGYYGVNKYMSSGVKVGSNIESSIHKDIKETLLKIFNKYQREIGGDSDSHIRIRVGDTRYGPHYSLVFIASRGTAWSSYGVELYEHDGSKPTNYFSIK
jgi:hypothetical protein